MGDIQANGVSGDPEDFIDRIVEFPDGTSFERLEPITDFRKDPGEARILYRCKPLKPDNRDEEYILKVKAQWPGPQQLMHEGPSPFTNAELKALTVFREQSIANVPHLITWKKVTQPDSGIHPSGYLVYVVMTKLPGGTLWDTGYWSMTDDERDEIKAIFMRKLNELRSLGFQPYDCALRNILWDKKTKQLGIIDFEHYYVPGDETPNIALDDALNRTALKWEGSTVYNEHEEYQRWGLVQRPPPRTWFQEWGLKGY